MPSKRCYVGALCTGTALIVVGGYKGIKTVEVLESISTRQWHTAAELPRSMNFSSMTICGDHIYLLGGCDKDDKGTKSVYSCSLTTLLLVALEELHITIQ